jgi:hypothetical protein
MTFKMRKHSNSYKSKTMSKTKKRKEERKERREGGREGERKQGSTHPGRKRCSKCYCYQIISSLIFK